MSIAVTDLFILLNWLANECAGYLLAPIAVFPGWLSATVVAAATGIVMLLIFKYTSKQRSVRRARDRIKANLLALSLFKDSVGVSLRCQQGIFFGVCHLLLLAVVPMLVATVPMCLLLAQLGLWYQARPLRVGEEAVVTVELAGGSATMPEIQLDPAPGAETMLGPVGVTSKGMLCWNVRAREDGCHRLVFRLDGRAFEKELAVGDGFMRVSRRRPARTWPDMMVHPREQPFQRDSLVQAVQIDYPARDGWTSGSRTWLPYWFAISLVSAFCLRPWLNVKI